MKSYWWMSMLEWGRTAVGDSWRRWGNRSVRSTVRYWRKWRERAPAKWQWIGSTALASTGPRSNSKIPPWRIGHCRCPSWSTIGRRPKYRRPKRTGQRHRIGNPKTDRLGTNPHPPVHHLPIGIFNQNSLDHFIRINELLNEVTGKNSSISSWLEDEELL